MYLTIKQEPRLSGEELLCLKELSHIAKNLYNEVLYSIRQYFFEMGKFLNYYQNYKELKNSENYKILNSNMAQQILKEESYTSKASFLDNDDIPVYSKEDYPCLFSGSRIQRGLYRSSNGTFINADINGALNIMKKALTASKADGLKVLSNLCIV